MLLNSCRNRQIFGFFETLLKMIGFTARRTEAGSYFSADIFELECFVDRDRIIFIFVDIIQVQ